MKPYPLTFEPILKEKVWGGRTLEQFGKNLPPDVAIGESWELADLPSSIPDGKSVIANGPLAGETLEANFPLLIKFLDACDNLSVQVHPSDAYAQNHPEAHLKSEAWIILDTTPDGCIYVGLKVTLRCIPLHGHDEEGTCIFTGKPSKQRVLWAKSY